MGDGGLSKKEAVVIQQVEQASLPVLIGQPAMGRGVMLPGLAHLLRLPAAHGGAMELEVELAQDFGSGGALGVFGLEELFQQQAAFLGPLDWATAGPDRPGLQC